jgi:hypothetical protein
LDKFFDHQRLKKEAISSGGRGKTRRPLTGFEYMWAQIKELELVFMKLGEKTKRLRRVKSHLQCYLDEMVWRIENRTLEQKRSYLINLLQVDQWAKYVKRLQKLQRKRNKRSGVEAEDPANQIF